MSTEIDFRIPFDNPRFGDWNGTVQAKGAIPVPVPVGALCLSCGTPIAEEEAGDMVFLVSTRAAQVVAKALAAGLDVIHMGAPDVPRVPVHRRCMLLDMFGHRFGVCGCTGYDGEGSRNDGAIELERRLYAAAAIEALGQHGAAASGRGDA